MLPRPEAASRLSWKPVVLGLLLPALGLRLLAVALAAGDPIVRFPFQDGLAYAKWAQEIAAGDWIGRGRPVFYQAPLYPYLLALLQTLGLGAWPWPQILHTVAGTATVLLGFLTARRLFGSRAGWVAGIALAVWGPALMYESLLDKTTVALLAAAASAWALVALHDRLQEGGPRPVLSSLLVGLLLGAGAMLRENLLVLAPVAAVFLWIRGRRLGPPLGLCGGVLLGLLPVLMHNGLLGGAWLPTTYQAGTNYYIGNHPGADGSYEPLLPGRGDPRYEEADARRLAAEALGKTAATLRPAEVGRYWLGRGLGFAAADPFGWVGLQLRKLQWFVFHAEAADSVPYAGFRAGKPWLLPSRLLFGLLFPFALLGLWVVGRDARARHLACLAIAACGSVVAFYVVSRYRLACLPFLVPFAARGACELRSRPVLVVAAALLAVPSQLWLPARPPSGLEPRMQEALLQVNRGTVLGTWTADSGAAIAAYERALVLEPDLLAAHRSLSRLLMAPPREDFARALPHCEAAVRLAPIDLEARHNLGYCLLRLGKLRRAEHELRLVLEAAGRNAPAVTLRQLAACLRKQGRDGEARRVLGR